MENLHDGIINSREIRPESENTCTVSVSTTHSRDGRRNKSALFRRELTPAIIARFSPKFKASGDGCWLWMAGKYRNGYGQFALDRSSGVLRVTQAHRVSYVLAHGDIPAGAVVMHSCDVPACVNPAHLSLGTQGDNVRDAARKGHYSGPRRPKKLTLDDVQSIYRSTEKGVRLAIRYGVSAGIISRIRRHGYRIKERAA